MNFPHTVLGPCNSFYCLGLSKKCLWWWLLLLAFLQVVKLFNFWWFWLWFFGENANGYNTLTLEEQVPGMYACSSFRKKFLWTLQSLALLHSLHVLKNVQIAYYDLDLLALCPRREMNTECNANSRLSGLSLCKLHVQVDGFCQHSILTSMYWLNGVSDPCEGDLWEIFAYNRSEITTTRGLIAVLRVGSY